METSEDLPSVTTFQRLAEENSKKGEKARFLLDIIRREVDQLEGIRFVSSCTSETDKHKVQSVFTHPKCENPFTIGWANINKRWRRQMFLEGIARHSTNVEVPWIMFWYKDGYTDVIGSLLSCNRVGLLLEIITDIVYASASGAVQNEFDLACNSSKSLRNTP